MTASSESPVRGLPYKWPPLQVALRSETDVLTLLPATSTSETAHVLIRTDGLIRRKSRNPANQRRRAHHRQARRPRTDCHQEQGNRRPSPRNTQGEQRHPKAARFHARRPHQEQTPRLGNFHTRRHCPGHQLVSAQTPPK